MRLRLALFAQCCATMAFAVCANAEDVALIVGNADYDNAPQITDAAPLLETKLAFENAGFLVFTVNDWTPDTWQRGLGAAIAKMTDADRIVVVLAGYSVHSVRDAWLLSTDAEDPAGYTIGQHGLSLGAMMDLATQARMAAVVLVTTPDVTFELGLGLAPGVGQPKVPDGVTLISGSGEALARLLSEKLLREGQSIRTALSQRLSGITVSGAQPSVALFPGTLATPQSDSTEEGYWRAAADLNTSAGYLAYISQYPQGAHLAEARAAIAALRDAPELQAQDTENALGLTSSARKAIQRNLTALGYNTNGVDGIFGAGTRSAISRWQRAKGFDATGYVTRDQVASLDAAASQRLREQEAEAARLQAAQDRKDRAFWQDVAAEGGEAELRAYLKAFPKGLYADVAKERLKRIEDDRLTASQAQERKAWADAKAANTVAAYRDYLKQYPKGLFAKEAQTRINALERPAEDQAAIDAAKAEESRVAGNSVVRLMVEQQLASLGLKPGTVDGTFTDATRTALRAYQTSRGMAATGYVTQTTLLRLLSGQ